MIDAVLMQRQNAPGTRVTLTLEVEAESTEGFTADHASVVRDHAKQFGFRIESTGCE